MNKATITIGTPQSFRMPQVLLINLFGLILGIPSGFCIGVGLFALPVGLISHVTLVIAVGVLGLLIGAVLIYFLPVLWANPYVVHIVCRRPPPASNNTQLFIVQLALNPRLHGGLRGWLEDADDVGYLSISSSQIFFSGDHVSFCIPTKNITGVECQNVGIRGFWLCGGRIKVSLADIPDHESIEFIDRSAIHVPEFRKNTECIVRALTLAMKNGSSNQDVLKVE